MRVTIMLTVLLLTIVPGVAQDRLHSPYGRQAQTGLRGLDEKEIADLTTGAGMGLARAAELNSYPGPRHVLDAIEEGKLPASREQRGRIQHVFDTMNGDAVRVGAKILAEEQQLEAAFSSATMTEADLRAKVASIAVLRGELRAIHLSAHVVTRRILSDTQIARYNELRGYTATQEKPDTRQHKH